MKILIYSLGLLLLLSGAFFAYIYWQNSQQPQLGLNNGQFKPLKNSPNGVSTQANDASKRVNPWPWKSDAVTTMQAIEASILQFGNAKVIQQDEHYLYVVFTTPTMKFNDDVEFWLDSNNKTVHYRSQSRAGKSDLGLNKQRYLQLEKLYLNQSEGP